ncbi:hypothetical protein ELE36_02560 [Pseudolysobacter antarcticus]|uniref:Uncharacterized protein n=1 Tax=Pseudolysobacter antarcticus TaxID=2511995 RepID=A0A411HFW1_9GAMM|nr:hypothetical protein [Pseudolysobacter antarcticus]QBB69344.1 hypothetical protein ELE36_02560 [Pseudolysobacter antarcticus]
MSKTKIVVAVVVVVSAIVIPALAACLFGDWLLVYLRPGLTQPLAWMFVGAVVTAIIYFAFNPMPVTSWIVSMAVGGILFVMSVTFVLTLVGLGTVPYGMSAAAWLIGDYATWVVGGYLVQRIL